MEVVVSAADEVSEMLLSERLLSETELLSADEDELSVRTEEADLLTEVVLLVDDEIGVTAGSREELSSLREETGAVEMFWGVDDDDNIV